MSPGNLCNNLLHKFPIRICRSEFRHILQVPDGITLTIRKSNPDISGKIIYKLVSPGFVFIDDAANLMVKQQHICIYMNCRTILCIRYFPFYVFYNGDILCRIDQHKLHLTFLWTELFFYNDTEFSCILASGVSGNQIIHFLPE